MSTLKFHPSWQEPGKTLLTKRKLIHKAEGSYLVSWLYLQGRCFEFKSTNASISSSLFKMWFVSWRQDSIVKYSRTFCFIWVLRAYARFFGGENVKQNIPDISESQSPFRLFPLPNSGLQPSSWRECESTYGTNSSKGKRRQTPSRSKKQMGWEMGPVNGRKEFGFFWVVFYTPTNGEIGLLELAYRAHFVWIASFHWGCQGLKGLSLLWPSSPLQK